MQGIMHAIDHSINTSEQRNTSQIIMYKRTSFVEQFAVQRIAEWCSKVNLEYCFLFLNFILFFVSFIYL